MAARIVQSNETPFTRVDVDTVTVDIIENALSNARQEMDAVVFRTALSPGIREQGDGFPMIANSAGKMIVGQFGSFIHGFLEAYQGTVEEGDVFLMNDPYECNGAVSHLPDWLVLVPVFRNGRVINWAAHFGSSIVLCSLGSMNLWQSSKRFAQKPVVHLTSSMGRLRSFT